jgi:uncharacterized membrane protein
VNRLARIGTILYGLAIIGFAALYLFYAMHRTGPVPGPPWTPGSLFLSWVLLVFLLIAGVCLVTNQITKVAAAALSAFFLLRFAFVHFPGLIMRLHDPGPWTSSFEILALSGGALVIAAGRNRIFHIVGCWFFAVLMVVVGVQHMMYAGFVATLVPTWMPARLFWAYFVGAAFFATAVSLLTQILARWAATLIGAMFVIFVAILHAPRVAAALHNGNEWTSLFVALAMAGSAWAIAGNTKPEKVSA